MQEVICCCMPGAGVEVTACYFPLTWDYEERRERCQEQYGFECTCPRCKVSPQQPKLQPQYLPTPSVSFEEAPVHAAQAAAISLLCTSLALSMLL